MPKYLSIYTIELRKYDTKIKMMLTNYSINDHIKQSNNYNPIQLDNTLKLNTESVNNI